MTQLSVSAEPLRRPKARRRSAGRGRDLADLGVSLWLMLWASCVSASVFLLVGH